MVKSRWNVWRGGGTAERVQPVRAQSGSRALPEEEAEEEEAQDRISGRGPHPALDIHLLSDHLSVTFPRHSPAWSPQVLRHGADMHCWRVSGCWRGPRAPGQPRQVFPYMMSDMRRDGAEALSRLQGPECGLRGRPSPALSGLCAEKEDFVLPLNRNFHF